MVQNRDVRYQQRTKFDSWQHRRAVIWRNWGATSAAQAISIGVGGEVCLLGRTRISRFPPWSESRRSASPLHVANGGIFFVIVITLYSASFLGWQTAKWLSVFKSSCRLLSAHLSPTHGWGLTLCLLLLRVKQKSPNYIMFIVWFEPTWNWTRILSQVQVIYLSQSINKHKYTVENSTQYAMTATVLIWDFAATWPWIDKLYIVYIGSTRHLPTIGFTETLNWIQLSPQDLYKRFGNILFGLVLLLCKWRRGETCILIRKVPVASWYKKMCFPRDQM